MRRIAQRADEGCGCAYLATAAMNPLLKTKLYLGDKLAETRLGRKVIGHFMGGDGDRLLMIFKRIAGQDPLVGGEKQAHKLYVLILQLAIKVFFWNC